jgi:MFS family permease
MNAVTFPTILSLNHIKPSEMGIAFALEISGGLLMSFFLSKLVKKLGLMNVLAIAASGYAAATSLIYFYQNFVVWLAFALFIGSCWFAYNITRQAWLNILLESHRRSVASGMFSMILAGGLATGPIIVGFSGAANYSSFLISSGIAITSFLFLALMRGSSRAKISPKRIPLKEFFNKNPRCFLARFFLDFQSYLMLVFTVIFGQKIGLSYEKSGLLITAFMASGFFDLWVGFIIKKVNPYKLINIGFLGSIYCFLIMTLYHESYMLLVILYFIYGIFIAFIFVSVLHITNHDYKKNELVAANSTFQIIGSSGSLCGSLVGGFFINSFGAYGFPVTMILSGILYMTFLLTHEKKFATK